MKAILAAIVLLALVGGAVVYAYNKHVEVSYLALRADHLERRIMQLESARSAGVEATTSDPTPKPHADAEGTPTLTPESRRSKLQRLFPDLYAPETPSAPVVDAPEPTPDLFIERMKRDQVAQDLKAEVPGIARLIAPNWTGAFDYIGLTRSLELYVPVYMASACLDGIEPSREGFKEMVTTGVVADSPGKIRSNRESLALRLIQTILAEREGQKAATNFCLQSYLYPESVSDAAPAVDLYLTLTSVNVPSDLRESYASLIHQRAAGWFNATEPRQPFIIWLCEWSSGNLCGL
jgi:hypothetical protein